MTSRSIAIKNKSRRGKNAVAPGFLPENLRNFLQERLKDAGGLGLIVMAGGLVCALASYSAGDPSLNTTSDGAPQNLLGLPGAYLSDILLQTLGLAAYAVCLCFTVWGARILTRRPIGRFWLRFALMLAGVLVLAAACARIPAWESWPLGSYLGGSSGALIFNAVAGFLQNLTGLAWHGFYAGAIGTAALLMLSQSFGFTREEWARGFELLRHGISTALYAAADLWERLRAQDEEEAPRIRRSAAPALEEDGEEEAEPKKPALVARKAAPKADKKAKAAKKKQPSLALSGGNGWQLPPLELLQEPTAEERSSRLDETALQRNAELLQSVLNDFSVTGDITSVSPGPVVTLYELEPAPGTKSSRVIGLSDDIARSMSAVSVRAAVVPGRNVIGIELPNARRETVYLRELLSSLEYDHTSARLPLVLGKNIAGEPVIADLARMPHLLVAGTTGSGKSVAINTMILSLLYRLPPEKCRFIMIDPKMLELSVYDDIPHLLSPVVTEPEKAIVALKWTVREMEDRYRAMSKLGVRNIEGYNARLKEARDKGETLNRKVQTGFDAETGKPVFEDQPMDLTELPYIVVVVDEFADLMIVAGKDVEAAIQRLAQMARAAGIHLIMATQRPSVDVITGTIKANFPTRISFQVTSKIDSRTILGDGGAEQLLGQGDMLYMAAGGRITRVHGPFVDDREVEQATNFLRDQGEPDYLDDVTEGSEDFGLDGISGIAGGGSGGDDLYDQAVALVARERKASTSFIQRYLQIGYNRAARIIEQMEKEGVVGKPNHVGKREIYVGE